MRDVYSGKFLLNELTNVAKYVVHRVMERPWSKITKTMETSRLNAYQEATVKTYNDIVSRMYCLFRLKKKLFLCLRLKFI